MKTEKILFIFLILLFSFNNINAQVKSYFGGTLNVFGSSGTSPEYTIQGFFNDTSGEYPLDSVAVGDILYISEGPTCVRLKVDTINSSAGGILDADVYDIDTILLAPPSGIGALMRETPNISLPRYVPGLSETLLSCIRTHMTGEVDQGIAVNTPDSAVYSTRYYANSLQQVVYDTLLNYPDRVELGDSTAAVRGDFPFSTTSDELEVSGGELRLAQQGADLNDVLRWNGVDAYEPAPVQSFEFVDTILYITVCNNLDTCDYLSMRPALQAATRLKTVFDTTTQKTAIYIVLRGNPDGSPIEITTSNNLNIVGGDYSGIYFTSLWNDSLYTVETPQNWGSNGYIFQATRTSNFGVDLFLAENTSGFTSHGCVRLVDAVGTTLVGADFKGYQNTVNVFRGSAFLNGCDFTGGNRRAVWNQNGYVTLSSCNLTEGVSIPALVTRGITLLRSTNIYNNSPNNIEVESGGVILSGDNPFSLDTFPARTWLLMDRGSFANLGSNPFSDPLTQCNIPINKVTNNGIVIAQGLPYSFQESTTAAEPDASSGIRFYYNTDEEELKVSRDSSTWESLSSVDSIQYVQDTISLTPKQGDVFINSTKDTMGVYSTKWQLFFGGSGGGGGGTVSDGDKGDITVSGSGAVWNIDNGVVGASELAATAVTAGEYTNPTITIDTDGRITAAESSSLSSGVQGVGTEYPYSYLYENTFTDSISNWLGFFGASVFLDTVAGNSRMGIVDNSGDGNDIVKLSATYAKTEGLPYVIEIDVTEGGGGRVIIATEFPDAALDTLETGFHQIFFDEPSDGNGDERLILYPENADTSYVNSIRILEVNNNALIATIGDLQRLDTLGGMIVANDFNSVNDDTGITETGGASGTVSGGKYTATVTSSQIIVIGAGLFPDTGAFELLIDVELDNDTAHIRPVWGMSQYYEITQSGTYRLKLYRDYVQGNSGLNGLAIDMPNDGGTITINRFAVFTAPTEDYYFAQKRVVAGRDASVSNVDEGTAVGMNSTVDNMEKGAAFGGATVEYDTQYGANSNGGSDSKAVAVGPGAKVYGWRGTAIGADAHSTAVSSTSVGVGSAAMGTHYVALGRGAFAYHPDSTGFAIETVIGGDNVTNLWIANSWGHQFPTPPGGITISSYATPSSREVKLHGQDAYDARTSPASFNIDGGDIGVYAGRATGSGESGSINFYNAEGDNGQNTKDTDIKVMELRSDGTLTDGTHLWLRDESDNTLKRVDIAANGNLHINSTDYNTPLSGSGAPAVAPRFNGDRYFDYTASKWYSAWDNEDGDGTGDGLDSDDWLILN